MKSPERVTAREAGHLSRGEGIHSAMEGLVLSHLSFPSTLGDIVQVSSLGYVVSAVTDQSIRLVVG